jgi:hypothetical protein
MYEYCDMSAESYSPAGHNNTTRRDIYKKDTNKSTHNILNSKHTDTTEHKNSSLKIWDHPHKISITIYTAQPAIRKDQGTPVTPYILVIRKLNNEES